MKLRDEETKQEKLERMTIVDKNRNEFIIKVIPILVIILVVMIALLVVFAKRDAEKNIGNPYECMDCKEVGRACRKHKKFDADADLRKKIKNGIYQYRYYIDKETEENYMYYLYGESNYNLECDFCKENQKECEGCKYTRQAILGYIKEVLNEETLSRLCPDCRDKGYPYCNSDVTSVSEMVYELIKN